ncbi:alpha-1,4-N-acetylglucosaminyltransferase-like isoform 1-T2 [Anomaloglossus baeobatrachus]|uniref:alpha-1,4-N-acetylglucosaminyltransferase-like isoform X2 n=1 Tax=Anomaloglossus baeobatrachus TaxID=238106 RepID=UPI003F5064A7
MLKSWRIVVFFVLMITLGFFFGLAHKKNIFPYMSYISRTKILNDSIMIVNKIFNPIHGWSNITDIFNNKLSSVQENMLLETINTSSKTMLNISFVSPSEVLKGGDGIIFLETTDRMQPPTLILCAIESAARVYKNRPVAFFMKGLSNTNKEEMVKRHFSALSSLRNVHFFPLKFEEVFADTPLHSWYQKIDPQQQSFWTHVSSDACRIALIWRHGGIYMDTDIISIDAIPKKDFLAAESSQYSSNGVFGFSPHHDFTQKCIVDFVQNYDSRIWGQQGPRLFTRILKRSCHLPEFAGFEDGMCGNYTLFNPKRFYPIPGSDWKKYYEVWEKLPSFNNSYALHLWNFVNKQKLTMVPGSNTLLEFLYKEHCPSTYSATSS